MTWSTGMSLSSGIAIVGMLISLVELKARSDEQQGTKRKKPMLALLVLIPALAGLSIASEYNKEEQKEANRARERETAMALYAFGWNKVPLLEETTTDNFLLGYRYYLNNERQEAEKYLLKAVDQDQYKAASLYILAYMETHDKNHELLYNEKNWEKALIQLNEAIQYDSKYTPAYYLRGKLKANATNPDLDGALKDLEISVMSGKSGITPCNDLNDTCEQVHFLGNLLRDSEAKKRLDAIASACKAKHAEVAGHQSVLNPKLCKEGKN